jgi:hypothetical protein
VCHESKYSRTKEKQRSVIKTAKQKKRTYFLAATYFIYSNLGGISQPSSESSSLSVPESSFAAAIVARLPEPEETALAGGQRQFFTWCP